jgi:DNA-binding beta-propeller fold protein YncE
VLLSAAFVLAFPGGAVAEFAPLSRFSEFGSGPGQLSSPAGAAVAANGDLYVADSGNDRAEVFAGDGTFLRVLTAPLDEPRDLALDDEGRVFVADTANDRVAVLSGGGAFLFAFEEVGEAKLAGPTGVAVAGSSVFVADTGNTRIAIFEGDGDFVKSFPTITTPPKDVIVGPEGNLYVIVEKRVEVYSVTGELVRSFGDEGVEPLDKPVALAVGSGQIFVADQEEDMIERFNLAGAYLGGFSVESDPAGVVTACGGNVFVVEEEVSFARIARFGEPGTPPPPCAEPSSGEPIQVSLIPTPSNRIRFAGLVKNRRNGSAVLFVRVPGPGRVILKGRGVRRLARGAPRAKVVRLPVKPKVRLRRFVKRHGKGRIRVEVTFRPAGGEPRSIEKVIVLKRRRG